MRFSPAFVVFAVKIFVLSAASTDGAITFFATQVIAANAGTGQSDSFADASLAIGGPIGGGNSAGSTDVYNLGIGGSITLGFDSGIATNVIRNFPGPDFTVFENAFYQSGNIARSFAELMFVEVSSDGVNFARFPVVSNTAGAVAPFGIINPANVTGFAGVHPVLANVLDNTIDPFDPNVSGGDSFNLDAIASDPMVLNGEVNLSAIRYLRLVDVLGDGSLLDANGHAIYDPTGPGNNGADVDSVAVINGFTGVSIPEPTNAMILGIAVIALRGRKRCAK